jgi:ELWxxDGT repeat protein
MSLHRACPLAILVLLTCLPALGQAPAFLVRDINADQPTLYSYEPSQESEGAGPVFYYVANDGIHGNEIWRTDGTPAGTFLLKDICPGAHSSNPRTLTGSNGLLFFVADDPQGRPMLWKSDGTPGGTSVVKGDLNGRADLGDFLNVRMTDAGGKLLFIVESSDGVLELWVTDGTQAGTLPVGDAARGFYSVLRFLAAGNGRVLFAAENGSGLEPWVTDGTNAGTHPVTDLNPGAGSSILFYNAGPSGKDAVAAPWGGFVFVADDGAHGPEIWKTDGTAGGTSLLKDITPGSSGSSPFGLTAVNGKVVFAATDPVHGTELWATDGTPAGTLLLQDVWPGGSSSDPREVTTVGSQAFFRASDGTHGAELWATDGTAAGTRLVKDLAPGSADSLPLSSTQYLFTSLGGHLLFYAPAAGATFWTSDGTGAGTQPLTASSGSWPYVDVVSSSTDSFGVAAGRLFFRGAFYPSIWVTDGSTAGSYKVLDVPLETSAFPVSDGTLEPEAIADLGGALLFQATDTTVNYELWRSDGTAAGTSQVKDLTGDAFSSRPGHFHVVNGRLVFSTFGQLGLSDGTEAGTRIVPGSSVLSFATKPLGSELFFFSQPAGGPQGLWKTDGTEAGTVPVAAHDPLIPGGYPVPSGGRLFYSLYDGTSSNLWVSDGTGPGTSDIGPGLNPRNLTDAGGTLFFSAFQPALFHFTLWKSNGTAAGTVQVKSVSVIDGSFAVLPGGIFLFVGDDGTQGWELWRSDGTDAGTVLVKDIRPGLANSWINGLTVAGNRAFFTADDGVHGLELWVSDGTAAGTRLVRDIVPGAGSSLPYGLTADGSTLVFTAYDPAYGVEAWRSDGTALGTRRLADVAPGSLSASPLGYTLSGTNLFFVADDNTTGFELWAVPQSNVLATFGDVPTTYFAWRFVEALVARGVTSGCAEGEYCPEALVSRAQMAVLLLAARGGAAPPPATGTRFQDVPASYWAAPWIEQLAGEGVVGGCSVSPPLYCPGNSLTRAEMAVLLVGARHETPPPATGTRFTDVPANYWAAPWIEQLAADGITGGCGGGKFCPDQPVTRGQMAVFLVTAFNLPLP